MKSRKLENVLSALVYISILAVPGFIQGAPARDDATYLAQQLKSDSVVTIQSGVYSPSRPIVLKNVSNLTVFAYGVTIRADAKQSTATAAQGDTLQLTNCQSVTILGVSFDGNRAARGGFAVNPETVRLNSCSDIRFRDCSFTNDVCDGIFAWSGWVNPPSANLACQRITVDSCRFSDPGRNCISFVGAAWSSVVNCDFTGPGGDPGVAVDVEANSGDPSGINHHITIANNRARGLKGAFWVTKTSGPSGVIVAENQIDGISGDAIFNEGSKTLIAANNVTNCAKAGVSQPQPGTGQITTNNASVYVEPK